MHGHEWSNRLAGRANRRDVNVLSRDRYRIFLAIPAPFEIMLANQAHSPDVQKPLVVFTLDVNGPFRVPCWRFLNLAVSYQLDLLHGH